ncbi:MAG: putative periplasmic cytochrome c containing protein [Nevskia sp.]|nr:putative periplasmic cytochrome c containing protein [Nevskia sp.]
MLAPAADAPAPPGSLQQRIAACTSCHGKAGEGGGAVAPYQPRLAGQPAGYLLAQMHAYQTGQRRFEVMQYMVDNLPQTYLQEIADYYAAQKPAFSGEPTTVIPAATLARGETLALRGDAALGVKACASCHGRGLEGDGKRSPALAGQNLSYLSWQMQAWKVGQRADAAESEMPQIAKALSDDDAKAVSTYLASIRPGQVQAELSAMQQPAADAAAVAADAQRPLPPSQGSFQTLYPVIVTAKAEPLVEQGRYLTVIGDCVGCHTIDANKPFAGGLALRSQFGTMYSSNITPDRDYGIGGWTDEQFYKAMHDGISPGLRFLYPGFPFSNYVLLTRDDVHAIKAYLDMLQAVHAPNRANELSWPFSWRILLIGWRLLFFHGDEFQANPQVSAELNRGEYLVKGPAHCGACHTPRNALGAERNDDFLAGSQLDDWYAANITSDKQSGIGDWSVEEIAHFLKTGVAQHITAALGPMKEVIHDSLQYLKDDDLHAIAMYLKTVPAKHLDDGQKQAQAGQNAPVAAAQGAEVYQQHCASCHGDKGEGRDNAYPPLAGNSAILAADPSNAIRTVLLGGFQPPTEQLARPYSMPPFAGRLSDQDIAAVVGYIRSSWGNSAGGVSQKQVNQRR